MIANTTQNRHGLYWFRHDLRLHDMPALISLIDQVDSLSCVFVWEPRWHQSSEEGLQPLGAHRTRFLQQTLADLSSQLKAMGQTLILLEGEPVSVLSEFVIQHEITHLGFGYHPGWFEREDIRTLQIRLPEVMFLGMHNQCLFDDAQLPFNLSSLPTTFTPFRKKVEYHASPLPPSRTLNTLPPPKVVDNKFFQCASLSSTPSAFTGGSAAGLKQLDYYLFESQCVTRYKETRNGLEGWDYSSKLSPWLANGSLSVRQVAAELTRFENEKVRNDSTYWLYFELLWREFFYWSAYQHGSEWFAFDGIRRQRPSTSFDSEKFQRWCQGKTGYPTVDACMRQLNQTGYMSNRGRQWVASCFVHELQQDWRFGAAYFEQQLLDFDVASNYGNWQYLAGVGADPRGHRQFNLDKQANMYDPKSEFQRRWLKGD